MVYKGEKLAKSLDGKRNLCERGRQRILGRTGLCIYTYTVAIHVVVQLTAADPNPRISRFDSSVEQPQDNIQQQYLQG